MSDIIKVNEYLTLELADPIEGLVDGDSPEFVLKVVGRRTAIRANVGLAIKHSQVEYRDYLENELEDVKINRLPLAQVMVDGINECLQGVGSLNTKLGPMADLWDLDVSTPVVRSDKWHVSEAVGSDVLLWWKDRLTKLPDVSIAIKGEPHLAINQRYLPAWPSHIKGLTSALTGIEYISFSLAARGLTGYTLVGLHEYTAEGVFDTEWRDSVMVGAIRDRMREEGKRVYLLDIRDAFSQVIVEKLVKVSSEEQLDAVIKKYNLSPADCGHVIYLERKKGKQNV